MKTSIIFFIVLLSMTITLKAQDKTNTPVIDKIIGLAMSAKVKDILKLTDTLNLERLNDAEKKIVTTINERFRDKNDNFEYYTQNDTVKQILKTYYIYWRTVLLREEEFDLAKQNLKNSLAQILKKNGVEYNDISIYSLENNLTDILGSFLNKFHMESVIDFNGTIADIYIWGKEVKQYKMMKLPKVKFRTNIIFMQDIITLGWQPFALANSRNTGGFVGERDGIPYIWCVLKNDRFAGFVENTESYEVSFLKHESQHFVDVVNFRNLSITDNEYRAKLIELMYSQKTTYKLINDFMTTSDKADRTDTHSYANYCLIRDLNIYLFKKETGITIDHYKRISVKKINKAAKRLLNFNTKALKKIGKSVTELIQA